MGEEKIIGYDDDGTYYSVEFDTARGYLSFSGSEGYVKKEKVLQEMHDEYMKHSFREDYGYVAEESGYEFGTDEYDKFMDRLASDFEGGDYWAFPEDINYDIDEMEGKDGESYSFTTYGGGQILEDLNPEHLLIPEDQFRLIKLYWEKYHLKNINEVPPEVIKTTRLIFQNIDNERQFKNWEAKRDFKGVTSLLGSHIGVKERGLPIRKMRRV